MVLCSSKGVIGKSALEIGHFLRQNFWMISGGPFFSWPFCFTADCRDGRRDGISALETCRRSAPRAGAPGQGQKQGQGQRKRVEQRRWQPEAGEIALLPTVGDVQRSRRKQYKWTSRQVCHSCHTPLAQPEKRTTVSSRLAPSTAGTRDPVRTNPPLAEPSHGYSSGILQSARSAAKGAGSPCERQGCEHVLRCCYCQGTQCCWPYSQKEQNETQPLRPGHIQEFHRADGRPVSDDLRQRNRGNAADTDRSFAPQPGCMKALCGVRATWSCCPLRARPLILHHHPDGPAPGAK